MINSLYQRAFLKYRNVNKAKAYTKTAPHLYFIKDFCNGSIFLKYLLTFKVVTLPAECNCKKRKDFPMNIRLCEYTVVWVYTDKLLYDSKTECCMTLGWLIVCIHEQQKYAYLKGISTKKSKGLGFFLRLTKVYVPTVREETFLLLIWSSYSMKGIWPKTRLSLNLRQSASYLYSAVTLCVRVLAAN